MALRTPCNFDGMTFDVAPEMEPHFITLVTEEINMGEQQAAPVLCFCPEVLQGSNVCAQCLGTLFPAPSQCTRCRCAALRLWHCCC